MVDPYILHFASLLPSEVAINPVFKINNLVFMDDSNLVSSTKSGMEYMLSITEEFYTLNNTSANHQKYTLISNLLPLSTTSSLSLVDFNLTLSSLNTISTLQIIPISITSSFHFLGV
ncbi:hypothetical protein RclHR1_10820014 [Rhizophagus clarus]|uniref:Reverse transcriptase domain-containing protein n=1 Tax=Rhizophagus clarus TaxID=94130 RepID=A0A2Z6QU08_9GLOM|nr:hypothetical protein RclHR1_10820014 [Rhizophagus clarus]